MQMFGRKKKSPSHRWGEKHKITFLVCEVKGVYVYKHADTANTGASLYPHETQSFALLTVLDESVTMPHLAVGEIACQWQVAGRWGSCRSKWSILLKLFYPDSGLVFCNFPFGGCARWMCSVSVHELALEEKKTKHWQVFVAMCDQIAPRGMRSAWTRASMFSLVFFGWLFFAPT